MVLGVQIVEVLGTLNTKSLFIFFLLGDVSWVSGTNLKEEEEEASSTSPE